jgi:cytoskeletal protein RodZ
VTRLGFGVAAAAVVATVLAACSTTTAGKGGHGPIPRPAPSHTQASRGLPGPSTPPVTAPVSSAPVTVPITSAPPSTAPVSSESSTPDDIARVLLTPGDLRSGGFTATPDNSVTTKPAPCTPNDPPIDAQVPSVEHGGVDLQDGAAKAEVDEQVAVYDTLSSAQKVQAAVERGFACSSGQLDGGQTIDISGPQDLSSIITPRVNKAEGWSIKASGIKGSLVLVRLNRVLVQFAFLAGKGSNPKINGKDVLNTGLAKVINGG